MFILIDIGGTKTRVARSTNLSAFDEPVVFKTPQPYQYALAGIVETVQKLIGASSITGISIGVPGVLTHDKRSIVNAPHLQQWNGAHLADDFEKALKTHVVLANDVELVGLGEAVAGAGVGQTIVAYVTISTGVNGVRIIDGKIDRSSQGFEIGGQYLGASDGAKTLEQLVSGSALENKYGVHPRDLGAVSPVWEELARTLAYGLNNTIVHWSPDCIVLGGSMMNEIGIPVPSVEKNLKEILKSFPETPRVLHSSLGDFGGLHGGMSYLNSIVH